MVLTRTRYSTATSAGTLVAFLLVLIFGSPWYTDWAHRANRGLFLETLAWPSWSFRSGISVRDLFAADLKAILLVAFTALFISLMVGAQLASARGSIAAIFTGWGAYIFAAALAALVTSFLLASASLTNAVLAAAGGAAYGLIVGWIVGLATMAARRPRARA
jgi:hypothetical protein